MSYYRHSLPRLAWGVAIAAALLLGLWLAGRATVRAIQEREKTAVLAEGVRATAACGGWAAMSLDCGGAGGASCVAGSPPPQAARMSASRAMVMPARDLPMNAKRLSLWCRCAQRPEVRKMAILLAPPVVIINYQQIADDCSL